ncbi:tandem-95 repeat protein [bacterium]|nr:tandem-95 repeat protein [bacterium]
MNTSYSRPKGARFNVIILVCALAAFLPGAAASAFTLNVLDADANPVTNGIRWMLELDNTTLTIPGVPTNDSISLVIHDSHAPVVQTNGSASHTAEVTVPDASNRYVISVLADGYATGGAGVAAGQTNVVVILNKHPLPTAQISVFVFHDNNSINNVPDATEQGLAGFQINLADIGGGPIMQDVFANPLGTTYATNSMGEYLTDDDGNYVVDTMGSGEILSDTNGLATIKFLAMGKYGVTVVPPSGSHWMGAHGGANVQGVWHQTATIEGTLTVDAWVTANESPLFIEGFGPGFYHAFFGFVDPAQLVWASNPPPYSADNVIVRGTNIFNHFGRPPNNQEFAPGPPVGEAWIGLNEIGAMNVPGAGLYAAPCDDSGAFEITNVPPGTYQLVTWDTPLDALFGFNTINVGEGEDGVVNLGNVLSYRWFGTFEGNVFYDENENGFKDEGEPGIPEQAVNLRFRDGSVYQATITDLAGEYQLSEVFPFFKWLVAEVDFARYKASGMTAVVDDGGFIPPDDGWNMPSDNVRNPQGQYETDPVTGVVLTDGSGAPIPIDNPNTGNHWSRTETGPVLTEAMHLFLNQNNRIDWGKVEYPEGENGGISGIAFYCTTRAEEDPRQAVGDGWEPGIPRVQMILYADSNADKIIDDLDGSGDVTQADVDNWPLGWADGGTKGPEDIDHNNDGVFDPGDALNISWTDSWDDNKPVGSIQTNPPVVLGKAIIGSDNYGTWNQICPAVFDGGYAFTSYFPGGMANGTNEVDGLPPGMYIVQAVPPTGYEIQKEESVNVVFGDAYQPSKLALLPECVGTTNNGDPLHIVPPYLTLFPDQQVPAPFAGQMRPLADMKWVRVAGGRNAAADFHMYTEVPKATRLIGFVLNDLTAEFNAFSPIYGEKGSPGWLPISVRDWAGNEVAHVYSDEYGTYNALVPSTYTVNVPSPSGVAPNMLTILLNDPTMADPTDPTGKRRIPDPHYNPNFSTTPWTLQYYPGMMLYADTPIVPIAGFVGYPNNQLDAEPADHTPVINLVTNRTTGFVGPLVTSTSQVIEITSMGMTLVPNPDLLFGSSNLITRDYSFGATAGSVTFEGMAMPIVSWSSNSILARIPATLPVGSEGRLMVTRGDSGLTTPIGVTLTYGAGAGAVHQVVPRAATGGDPLPDPIQEAVDAANPGDLILVGPGIYYENPIIYKPVRVQGAGAGTVINANPSPSSRLSAWHAKVVSVLGSDPFPASENSGFTVFGVEPTDFTEHASRIDGFAIRSSIAGGGVQVYMHAHNLRISNNRIDGNQGTYCGGISLGQLDNAGTVFYNSNVVIQGNQILKNGGVNGAGGIAVYTGAAGYRILDNLILGNFCRGSGGGIGHEGLSDGGLIARNIIRNNEVFYGIIVGGDGGGIFIGGEAIAAGGGAALSSGSGSVTIDGNLIQGNLSGSGSGGGICLSGVNGVDVQASPNPLDWYAVNIFNNVIVNNVAGYAGGGISMSDAARVTIIHNTIAHNDSSATSQSAFQAGENESTPQGAGIASFPHTDALQSASGQEYSNPTLYDSIIWHNRSYYYSRATQSLAPAPGTFYKDLQSPSGQPVLNARYCLLSSAAGYHSSNIADDPEFIAGYTNYLVASAVIDEAGNNINVRFEPTGAQGNYHIPSGSPARDEAESSFLNTYPVLRGDFDTQYRPYSGDPDIGADEYSVTTVFATNDIYAATEDTLLVVAAPGVLTNDSGPGALTAQLDTTAGHGVLTLASNGSITYRPESNFYGVDSFTYRARYNAARSTPAEVLLVVQPVNDPPVAVDDAYDTAYQTTLTVPAPGVLINDTDRDFEPLTAVLFSGTSDGALTLNPDGSFEYTPDNGFDGVDTFYYMAADSKATSSIAVVTITVAPPAPEYTVREISLVPAVVTNGGTFNAFVTVWNQGAATGAGARLSIWLDRPGADVPPATPEDAFAILGTLPAGGITTVVFNALAAPPIPAPGDNQFAPTFRAFADSTGGAAEQNENNNQRTLPYLVVRYDGTPALQGTLTNGMFIAQDMVTMWNLIALQMVKTNMQMAPVASRTLAMVHGAGFDAVNSIEKEYNPYRVSMNPGYPCSPDAAVAAAAHRVLAGVYTGYVGYLNVSLTNLLAMVPDGIAKTNGINLGAQIADQMLAWRAGDMMQMMMTNYTPGVDPGDWRPTPPGYLPPMMPHWGMAEPFAMMHMMQFRPPAPPELDSAEYAASVNEVQTIGALASTNRTMGQTQTVMFWTDMPGTITTAGRWNQIARFAAAARTNSLYENARLFALLNVAEADAGIMAWDAKYHYNRWRPIAAIREADTDGNPDTVQDAGWTPFVTTPAFPEYVSAHSSFSAAAAGILSGFFGTDSFVFAVQEYMNPNMVRYYGSFSEAANEAGVERVWGGIHFSYGNEQGLAAGYALAGYVHSTRMIPSTYPKDTDNIDTDGDGDVSNDVKYVMLAASDGFVKMADGNELYCFGFSDMTDIALQHGDGGHGHITPPMIMMEGMLKAEFSAPTMVFKEGQRVYLDLANVGMMMRPDLFDPHTVHFHGFPNAAPIFDGEPMGSISVNMGSTLRYYYEIVEPGTFMYHCHVEATEHMEMGMLGNLYVLPKQNNLPEGTDLNGFTHHAGYTYAYNDGDGSTHYDVDFPIQVTGFDRYFHEQHIAVQPLPFWSLDESYPMINGRGYPETISTNWIYNASADNYSQKINALVTATAGQKILLRISNLSVADFHSITVLGIPMTVVGKDARLLRGANGSNLYYRTHTITLGGGEAYDAILDTTGVAPGTYFLYDARLNHLSNDTEDYGGMMTEIRIQ